MGTNIEMLRQLRMLASNQPKEDRLQQIGWRGRVKLNLKRGKAWLAIEEGDAFDDDADNEIQDYIFLCRDGNGGDGREETFMCHCIDNEISVINK